MTPPNLRLTKEDRDHGVRVQGQCESCVHFRDGAKPTCAKFEVRVTWSQVCDDYSWWLRHPYAERVKSEEYLGESFRLQNPHDDA